MTDDEMKQLERFTRDVLHMAGHTDEQIEAIRLKAVEDAKPKPRVIIPWVPVPTEAWDKHHADEAAKKQTKALKTTQDQLAGARRALEVEQERAEDAEKKAKGLDDQLYRVMKAQKTEGK
jgi:hypothetical protein